MIPDDTLHATVEAYSANGNNQVATALALGIARQTLQNRLRRAAERGLMGFSPILPGFRVAQVTNTPAGDYIKQKPDLGEDFQPAEGLVVKGRTTWAEIQPDGTRRALREVIMERAGADTQLAAIRAVADGLKDELPRAAPVAPPAFCYSELLSFYAVTDLHMGALAWHEETGGEDYDLAIAERLIEDWFAAAIELAPPAETAVLAQMGDLLHWDGFDSVTPTSKHVLDGDSRFPKMVRAAIRVLRRVIRRLLEKHSRVHIVMADANHDPASGVWLREMFAAFYEDEIRVTVDQSSSTYYAYRHGDVSLFVHHGHRRKIADVDSVFAGRFREMYGSTKYSFAHLGHLHSDELKSTNLMKVERHETLAAPDAYAANGGWLSGRSAKVITYHKRHGEVGRLTLTPGMVEGWRDAANDNQSMEKAA